MFAKYIGPDDRGFPKAETTYWIKFSNGGAEGQIVAWIPIGKSEGPLWSCNYKSFEAFALEWEVV